MGGCIVTAVTIMVLVWNLANANYGVAIVAAIVLVAIGQAYK